VKRTILHCDLNNFFASVERVLDPSLVGRPLAVCGDPEERRGIVLAKCEMAKALGIKTGDTVWKARQLCPDIQIVTPRHNEYSRFSRMVQEIYYRFTDKVESFGQDECWLDVTGSKNLFGDGTEIANEIRKLVKSELGLTISVGVSWNKTFAKLGSDLKKPDATTVISQENFKQIVWPLPVSEMLFVGRKTARLLAKLGVKTIGELASFDIIILKTHIGIAATKIITAARGECDEPVGNFHDHEDVKSVGNGATFPYDLMTKKEVHKEVYVLSEQVAARMRKKNVQGTTVNLGIRDSKLLWHGAQTTLASPTSNAKEIMVAALEIYDKLWLSNEPIRSLRVSVTNLSSLLAKQVDMFTDKKAERFDELFDDLRKKYGANIVSFGTGFKKN